MKKRAMKKWIPKRTQYCYNDKVECKWRKYIKTIKYHRDTKCSYSDTCNEECWTKGNNSCQIKVYRCEFLNYTDWNEDSLIWDKCKECGQSEMSEEEYLFVKYKGWEK